MHPADKAAVFAEWQRTAALKCDFDMEFRVRRDDGTVREVRSISRPVLDDEGHVTDYVGSVEDITERKSQERSLRRSEALLNRTGALAQVGGWELDIATAR